MAICSANSDQVRLEFPQYRNFFRKLQPYSVSIPFADEINFKIVNTESRRSAKIFMDLLSAVALINQKNRTIDGEAKILYAEKEDFDLLIELISKDASEICQNLNRCESAVYGAIQQFQDRDFFVLKDIQGLSYGTTSIKNAVSKLCRLGILDADKSSKTIRYRLEKVALQNDWGVMEELF